MKLMVKGFKNALKAQRIFLWLIMISLAEEEGN